MHRSDLTAQRLRELVSYDLETGKFKFIVSRGSRRSGQETGCVRDNRVMIGIDGFIYEANRLAWLWVKGVWPLGLIDHIDGNPSNNSLKNLREASYEINAQNQRSAKINNKVGLLGVSQVGKANKWQATITIHKKKRYIGVFETPELAHYAYLKAKRELHDGCSI